MSTVSPSIESPLAHFVGQSAGTRENSPHELNNVNKENDDESEEGVGGSVGVVVLLIGRTVELRQLQADVH